MTKRIASLSFPIVPFAIWLLAFCLMIFLFVRKLTPVYTQESLNSFYFTTTPALRPGDALTQNFTPTQDKLYSIDIAFSYDETISDDAVARISLLCGSEVLLDQVLNINVCPNNAFLTLYTDLLGCAGDTLTLRIENISDSSIPPANTAFSLMATDRAYLYLDNTEDYYFQNLSQNARILCRFSYQTGYSYYQALTYAFWVFLLALIATKLFSQASLRFQR